MAALSDDIAYVNHDIDDGLRAGLFAVDDLFAVPLAGTMFREVAKRHPGLELGRLIGEAVRRLITSWSTMWSQKPRRLAAAAPKTAADVRAQPAPMVAFPACAAQNLARIERRFLYACVCIGILVSMGRPWKKA